MNGRLGRTTMRYLIYLLYLGLGLATLGVLVALTNAVDRWERD